MSSARTPMSEIRSRARDDVEGGAVTAGYAGDREAVVGMLDAALATELVCVLRYRRHHYAASGLESRQVAEEFLAHANEELGHADRLARRIVQLGGQPDFAPDGLSKRSHADYVAPAALEEMIRENLVAERIAIDSYREMICRIGEEDSTTRRVLEEILAKEEEHADDLASLLDESGDSKENA